MKYVPEVAKEEEYKKNDDIFVFYMEITANEGPGWENKGKNKNFE